LKNKFIIIITEEDVIPSCSLRTIGTVEQLAKKNIVLLDVKCANVSSISANCQVGKSHLIYQCKNGFNFANNQPNPSFKSVCGKNGWSKAPKCIPSSISFNIN
jgi:hypothetical protein